MALEIRLSKEKDFQQLIELEHLVWSAQTTPSIIKWESVSKFTEKNPEGSQLVALQDGIVAGYLGFHPPTPLKTNQHVLEIDIAVGKTFQGRGIGKALLDEGKRLAKDRGIKKVSLRVLATNESAYQFYKKCGFIEQGRLIKEFYLDGKYVDDILMYVLVD